MDPDRKRAIVLLLLHRKLKEKQLKKHRSMYVRKLFLARKSEGETLLLKHLEEDMFYHHKYYRMNAESLEMIMTLVGPKLEKSKNQVLPISAKQSLAVTLRYLATGNSQISLGLSYNILPSSVCQIILEVLDAIYQSMQGMAIPEPTIESWIQISTDFWLRCNFPNCIGAADGKHIRIKCPAKTGSNYFNYKKFFSIILFAIADSHYRFSYVDIGAYGSEGDSTIFRKSTLGKRLENGSLQLPEPTPLPTNFGTLTSKTFPFVLVADDAFPLKQNILKRFGGRGLTYTQRIFNYRLSRARRVVENSFGILAAKFRIFHTPIHARPETVDKIIWATCILHNFLIDRQGLEPTLVDSDVCGNVRGGEWREHTAGNSCISNINLGTNNYTRSAKIQREKLSEFFVSPLGSVSWQQDSANKGNLNR